MADILDELLGNGAPPEALAEELRKQLNMGTYGALAGDKRVAPMGREIRSGVMEQATGIRERGDAATRQEADRQLRLLQAKLSEAGRARSEAARAREGALNRANQRDLAGMRIAAADRNTQARIAAKTAPGGPAPDFATLAQDMANLADTAAKARGQTGRLSAGLAGHTSIIGGSPAADLRARITPLASNLAFEKLKELKAASKTGASGLGSVTEREIDLLINSISSLDQLQSPDQLRESLTTIEAYYARLAGKLARAARGEDLGEAGADGGEDDLDAQMRGLLEEDDELSYLLGESE